MSRRLLLSALLIPLALALPVRADDDLETLKERAIKAALEAVGPSVVQIETTGGSEVIAMGRGGIPMRKGVGPTSGVIVAPDGYIISSSFNFANKPSAIFIAVPGQKDRYVAKAVARDTTRMLTLLKIDANNLPVPVFVPESEMRIGQTALAMGRGLDTLERLPTVSVGIISALQRIWGKALQTDAKVSPINYGGPLVDLTGRVQGILVPASPNSDEVTAGVEWYDSGIGFAIPMEHVMKVVPRLREGKDLQRGILGITTQEQQQSGQGRKQPDLYDVPATVGLVAPGSTAEAAGIKPGDVLKELDGKPIANEAQMRLVLATKYEGDTMTVKLLRDKEEISLPNLKLLAPAAAAPQPFLGILPLRDDPELGVEIRWVFPKSPAEAAGLQAGDRIMKLGAGGRPPRAFSGSGQLDEMLSVLRGGTEVKVEVKRKDGKKTETLTVKLGEVTDAVPDALPAEASAKKALEPRKTVQPAAPAPPKPEDKKEEKKEEKKDEKKEEKKKPETGLLEHTSPAGDRVHWIYVPKDYDPNISYALVVWLHPAGKGKKEDMEELVNTWEDYCKDNHLILVAPKAENDTGWVAGESDFVSAAVQDVTSTYTIDRRRVIAHGMGVGGQMAFYLGFHLRDLFHGVATTGAAFTGTPKERVDSQPLAFFVVAGGKDPLAKTIAETKTKLAEQKHPVVHREIPNMGHQYLDLKTIEELVRWIDSLDRL